MAIQSSTTVSQLMGRVGYEVVTRTIIEDIDMNNMKSIFKEVAGVQLKAISEKWVEDNQGEILKHLNPQAVANLAIADSARHVREKFIDPPKKESKK
jgi:hypothetical protein